MPGERGAGQRSGRRSLARDCRAIAGAASYAGAIGSYDVTTPVRSGSGPRFGHVAVAGPSF